MSTAKKDLKDLTDQELDELLEKELKFEGMQFNFNHWEPLLEKYKGQLDEIKRALQGTMAEWEAQVNAEIGANLNIENLIELIIVYLFKNKDIDQKEKRKMLEYVFSLNEHLGDDNQIHGRLSEQGMHILSATAMQLNNFGKILLDPITTGFDKFFEHPLFKELEKLCESDKGYKFKQLPEQPSLDQRYQYTKERSDKFISLLLDEDQLIK